MSAENKTYGPVNISIEQSSDGIVIVDLKSKFQQRYENLTSSDLTLLVKILESIDSYIENTVSLHEKIGRLFTLLPFLKDRVRTVMKKTNGWSMDYSRYYIERIQKQ